MIAFLGRGLAVMALVAITASCAHASPSAGPLTVGGGDRATLCADPGSTKPLALAAAFVQNTGGDPVTIESVSLVNAEGVEAGSAYAIPQGDNWYTIGAQIPPLMDDPGVDAWNRRKEAAGTVIAPGETWQVIRAVHILSDDDAEFEALRVDYSVDGHKKYGVNNTSAGVTGYGPCR